MKKTYQAPIVNSINVTMRTICAGSLGNGSTPTVNTNDASVSTGGMSADTRRHSIWDDEEDE